MLQVRTNWVGLIDEWATRFFHELDYEREAQNGMTFKEQMAGLDGIVVADVYQHLSNKEVLTTVWIQGESFCNDVNTQPWHTRLLLYTDVSGLLLLLLYTHVHVMSIPVKLSLHHAMLLKQHSLCMAYACLKDLLSSVEKR
jgi:hypothetical protein